jgi:hypothetical protein
MNPEQKRPMSHPRAFIRIDPGSTHYCLLDEETNQFIGFSIDDETGEIEDWTLCVQPMIGRRQDGKMEDGNPDKMRSSGHHEISVEDYLELTCHISMHTYKIISTPTSTTIPQHGGYQW